VVPGIVLGVWEKSLAVVHLRHIITHCKRYGFITRFFFYHLHLSFLVS
jgi:hypothetical protein